MSGSRRGSALLKELSMAEAKIGTLEEFISERERQLHVAVSRLRGRGDARRTSRSQYSSGARRRRAGITPEVLHMHTSSRDSLEQVDNDAYLLALRDYVCLRLVRVEESDASLEGHVPFILSRLVGRGYHVGPEGVTIGTSTDCVVRVPPESEVWPTHAQISWNASSKAATMQEIKGQFSLCDLTEGKSVFQVLPDVASLTDEGSTGSLPTLMQYEDEKLDQGSSKFSTRLSHGIQFQTGRLVWSLTALPEVQVLTMKMFSAAREGSLKDLRHIDNSLSDSPTPFVFVTPPPGSGSRISQYKFSTVSIVTEKGIDVNTEYRPPNSEDSCAYYRLSSVVTPSPVSSGPLPHPSPYLLLHIAVVNGDLDMVLYLLDKGADVNLKSGPLSVTSLHLASQIGQPSILYHLLARGGDVELKNANSLTPLDVTSCYEIRKLLLNSVLLCSASEAGDLEEVARLLTQCGVPVNVCGLRHKAPLHLASSCGHGAVVDLLLTNGANVSSHGGSQRRTPLHYASLHNHVTIATKLLAAGASECARDIGGLTPLNLSMGGDMCKLLHKQPLSLCLAVQSEDLQQAQQLLEDNEGKTDNLVDQRNEHSHAPLHIACTTGNMELVELLISHGADVNLRGGCDGWTPLFYAALAGHSAVVEFLLAVGASTEELDDQGESVEVRVQGAVEMVEERLKQLQKSTLSPATSPAKEDTLQLPVAMTRQESQTSYSTENEQSWLLSRHHQLQGVASVLTPLHERLLKAMESRSLSDFVQVLSSESVSPDILVDRHCPIPVLIKTIQHGLFQFTEEVLKQGATVSCSGLADSIPLLVAAENGHCDILRLLVAHGASVNVKGADTQNTALHEASSAGSLECVQYLLSQEAEKTAINCNGDTPFDCTTELEIRVLLAVGINELLVAACVGDSDIIRSLVIEKEFSPSHQFQQGVTALHEACEGGHEHCVAVLIELGAEVNKQTLTTQASPLHIASCNDHLDTAVALLKAGAKLDLKDSDGKVPFEVANSNQMRKTLIEARSMHVTPVQYHRETSKEARLCKICMDNTINTIILPCGHQAFCTTCVSQINVCALDRKPIREVITIYK